jgi:hypothetical protein
MRRERVRSMRVAGRGQCAARAFHLGVRRLFCTRGDRCCRVGLLECLCELFGLGSELDDCGVRVAGAYEWFAIGECRRLLVERGKRALGCSDGFGGRLTCLSRGVDGACERVDILWNLDTGELLGDRQ